MGKPEDLSDCEPETRVDVTVVPDVPVSPSSVVTEMCEVSPCCSDWEFVEPMMPPTPSQNSYSSLEEEQGHFNVVDQMWSARDRTIIAKTNQYLEESKSLKLEIEELESLLGPEDSYVDFRQILEEARDEKGCNTGEGCGERMKEKERARRALLSFVGWPVSFESFDVRRGVLVERGFSFPSLCHRVVFIVLREFSMR